MKGGITSGVVYPLAVCELAQFYKFRSIGGTSAGAIAASATAAAEYGRAHGGRGFSGLAELPEWLGRDGNLVALFQPQSTTRAVFRTLLSFLGLPSGRFRRVVVALVRNFPLPALLGSLPGLVLLGLSLGSEGSALRLPTAIAGALLGILGMGLGMGTGFALTFLRSVPNNGYGLCNGSETSGRRPALTPWLSGLIQDLAGRNAGEPPLTFGDLWETRDPKAIKAVNLEMVTTNLTHGRPYRLPFAEKTFYFKPDEFRRLFPREIVDWMVAHPRVKEVEREFEGLVRLPEAADVPIVVAARMSLSFPILLSAVPLYAIDYSRKVENEMKRQPERCWFSDGGICSNFPIHFFDAPLPSRPTFGINLRAFHPNYQPKHGEPPDEATSVWMPKTNQALNEWWTRFDETLDPGKQLSDLDRVGGFLGGIFGAMQDWRDNLQLKVPGFRDRVVHVSLSEEEGGLNLNMPVEVIDRLSNRGRLAGQLLQRRYSGPPEPGIDISWDNHRWVRYRTIMGVLEGLLQGLNRAFTRVPKSGQTYRELVERGPNAPPGSYRWESPQAADAALRGTDLALALPGEWESLNMSFEKGAPAPTPDLRVTPRY
jgi:Patatin-like phospholipase